MKFLGKHDNGWWHNFKKTHPNFHIILVSIAIVTWFKAVTGILMLLCNNKNTLLSNLILIFFSLTFLYTDDFSLSELYNANKTAAVVSTIPPKSGY